MAVKRADQLVCYLGNFPFTIDYVIGRITLFFIQILKNVINYVMREEAVSYNRIEASRFLLQNGADINAKISNGGNVLHLAIEYGADEDIIKLVIAYGVDLEAKCDHLQAPLFDAIHYLEKTDVFEVLIANGANVNVKCLDIGESLLHYAIAIGKYDFVKILAKSSHFMKVKNLNGKTPMEVVFSKKDIDNMKMMIFQSKDHI